MPDGGGPAQLGIVAPGTGGARAVIAAVVDRWCDRDVPVVRLSGRRLEAGHDFGALADAVPGLVDEPDERAWRAALLDHLADTGAALVVDDAQWLDRASLRVLVGVAERAAERGIGLTVAHRPTPGDGEIAALDAVLGRSQLLAALGPLDEREVAETSAIVLDAPVDDRLVEAVHDHSGGMAELVELVLAAWSDSGVISGGRLTGPVPPPSPSLVAALRARIDELEPDARTVLEALSAGADLDDHLLSATTGIAPDQLGGAIDELRAAGLVAPDTGEVIPVVAAASDELTPLADRRRFHSRLAEALAERGAPAARTGEHLAAAGAQGAEAAAAFVAAGDETLAEAPELAAEWYDRAVAAGTPATEVAARRAEASALTGDTVGALRLADQVVAEPGHPERARALAVVAALLPARGFWGRAARAYDELDALSSSGTGEGGAAGDRNAAAWPLLAAVGALVTGQRRPVPGAAGDGAGGDGAEARSSGDRPAAGAGVEGAGAAAPDAATATATGRGPDGDGVAGLEVAALRLTCAGLSATVTPDGAQALPAFLEAAELLESAHTTLVLPTSPHAIGATVALALNELTTAEHLLTRARDHGIGGPSLAHHHRLALGWVAVRSGRWAAAQAALDEVADATLAPREVLIATAIDAGLARRSGDLTRLREAWNRAEGVLLRHPADLLTLDVVGELAIAAARLGLWERVAPKARELGDVVRALGEPPLWLLPLRWIGLQVALATDDHKAVRRRAKEVAQVTPVHPRLTALADAAHTWVAILDGTAEPDAVQAAAKGLANLGLLWEASRLTGQAAIRSSDPAVTRQLLEQARDLKAALPSSDPGETAAATSVLSEREQMVAQYIVDGLTHKEIGAQLYISPKTVEHHVAKIRQKLGASTRAEMLAALRTQLAS